MTDQELIKKILEGDKTSLRFFYIHYKQRLFGFIKRKINNLEDGEEILQDILIEALDALRDFTGRSSLYTYLCSIASHKVIDYYRKRKIKSVLFSQIPEDIRPLISQLMGPEEQFSLSEVKKQIEEVFSRLKPNYCLLLKLKYIEGFSVVEIAKKLVVSSKSVESNLFRARSAFMREYRVLYVEE